MSKEQLKKSIRAAIENDPNKSDIVKVSLFGSHLHGAAKKDSDVDLLIEFDPDAKVGLFKLSDFKHNFQKYIGKEVDLVTPEALSKYFRDQVINEAYLIYER